MENLHGHLSMARTRMTFSQEFQESLRRDFDSCCPQNSTSFERFLLEPYRQKMILVYRRLKATFAAERAAVDKQSPTPALTPPLEEFVRDLTLVQESVRQNKGDRRLRALCQPGAAGASSAFTWLRWISASIRIVTGRRWRRSCSVTSKRDLNFDYLALSEADKIIARN
ncbi:MAG: phosphoenolpyruvate carboxylase [Caldilineaceae bacterium]